MTTLYFVCAGVVLGGGLIAIKADMSPGLVYIAMGWCGLCVAQGLLSLKKVNYENS